MRKNRTVILAVSFLLLVVAVGCSKSTNSSTANTNVARSGAATENSSGTNAAASPTSAPLPDNSSKRVQVRLTEVETNADLIDAPIANSKVTIKAGEASLDKQTDHDGVVLFDSVPCGGDVVITAHDEDSDENTVLHHKLECAGAQVDLGVLTKPFGGKFILEQRKPQHMEYDPTKNVWRSEGKIVPSEKAGSILKKYMQQ